MYGERVAFMIRVVILVVDFDKIEIQVECQFETIGQFHFVITFVSVDFYN